MKLSVTLNEEELLSHQLYVASINPLVKAGRRKRWILIPVVLTVLAIPLILLDSAIWPTFLVIAAIWAIFYPIYARVLYRNHYKKHVKQNMAYHLENTAHLHFDETKRILISEDDKRKLEISFDEFDQLVELQQMYLLSVDLLSFILIPTRNRK